MDEKGFLLVSQYVHLAIWGGHLVSRSYLDLSGHLVWCNHLVCTATSSCICSMHVFLPTPRIDIDTKNKVVSQTLQLSHNCAHKVEINLLSKTHQPGRLNMSLDLAPPCEGVFPDYDSLFAYLHEHAGGHGYAVAIGRSTRYRDGVICT